jgi:hypothetical protein
VHSTPAYHTLFEMPEFFSVPVPIEHSVALTNSNPVIPPPPLSPIANSPPHRSIFVTPCGDPFVLCGLYINFVVCNHTFYTVPHLVNLGLKAAFLRYFVRIYKICLHVKFHAPDSDYSLIVALKPWRISTHFCAADTVIFFNRKESYVACFRKSFYATEHHDRTVCCSMPITIGTNVANTNS